MIVTLAVFLAWRLLYYGTKKMKEGIAMKFYIASHSGIASDGMSYKESGWPCGFKPPFFPN